MGYVNDFPAGSAYQRQRLFSGIGNGALVRRVVLVEPRLLIRASIEFALAGFLPDAEIDCVSLVDEIDAKPADLILLGIDSQLGMEPTRLRSAVYRLQRLSNGSPIAAYLYDNELGISVDPRSLDLVGVVPSSCGLEILIAAVQLMLAGGTYLPTGGVFARDESKVERLQPPAWDPGSNSSTTEETSHEVMPPWALSPRERDVLAKLRDGHQNKIIAFELGISQSTVKVHLRNIMKKMGATNRTQVVMRI
jgi:DNA-binding NarL/FixJ family response regulator